MSDDNPKKITCKGLLITSLWQMCMAASKNTSSNMTASDIFNRCIHSSLQDPLPFNLMSSLLMCVEFAEAGSYTPIVMESEFTDKESD